MVRHGDGYASAPGTDIQHSVRRPQPTPWLKLPFNQLGQRGSRDQNPLVDLETQPRKPGLTQ
jgi:hypothetical protein